MFFEKTKSSKFGRGWPDLAGVTGNGCGIVSLLLVSNYWGVIFEKRYNFVFKTKKSDFMVG